MRGVTVAVGDVIGDITYDLILAPSRGRTNIKVFSNNVLSGQGLKPSVTFNAFSDLSGYQGGASIAAADLDGFRDDNSNADLIVGSGPGTRDRYRIFDVRQIAAGNTAPHFIREIRPFASNDRGGVNVAIADIQGDDRLEIIAGAGTGGHSRIETYETENYSRISRFFAYDGSGPMRRFGLQATTPIMTVRRKSSRCPGSGRA